jgi:hypothetical protein
MSNDPFSKTGADEIYHQRRRIPRPWPSHKPQPQPQTDEQDDEGELDDLNTATKKKTGGPLSPATMKKLERAREVLSALGINFFHPGLVLPQQPEARATLPDPSTVYALRKQWAADRRERGFSDYDADDE